MLSADLSAYQLSSIINDYAKTDVTGSLVASMDEYIESSKMSGYALISTLEDYATVDSLTSYISSLVSNPKILKTIYRTVFTLDSLTGIQDPDNVIYSIDFNESLTSNVIKYSNVATNGFTISGMNLDDIEGGFMNVIEVHIPISATISKDDITFDSLSAIEEDLPQEYSAYESSIEEVGNRSYMITFLTYLVFECINGNGNNAIRYAYRYNEVIGKFEIVDPTKRGFLAITSLEDGNELSFNRFKNSIIPTTASDIKDLKKNLLNFKYTDISDMSDVSKWTAVNTNDINVTIPLSAGQTIWLSGNNISTYLNDDNNNYHNAELSSTKPISISGCMLSLLNGDMVDTIDNNATRQNFIGFFSSNEHIDNIDLSGISYVPTNFLYKANVNSITIDKDKLEKVYNNAFRNVKSLSSIDFSNCEKLNEIANNAFHSSSLKDVDFSNCSNLSSVGSNAFNSSSLSSISFSGCVALSTIENLTFGNCDKLFTFNFKDIPNLTKIGQFAFQHSALSSIDFSNCEKLNEIGVNAFCSCDNLSTVTIPSSVKTIFSNAFGSGVRPKNHKLSSIYYQTNDVELKNHQFYIYDLKTVEFLSGSDKYDFDDHHVLYSKDGSRCLGLTNKYEEFEDGIYELSGDTRQIDRYAFSFARNLSTLIFNDGLTTIDDRAIANCTSLVSTDFTNASQLNSISDCAFQTCKNLHKIDLSDCSMLSGLGYSPFESCEITSLLLPMTLESMTPPANNSLGTLDKISACYISAYYGCMGWMDDTAINDPTSGVVKYGALGDGAKIILPAINIVFNVNDTKIQYYDIKSNNSYETNGWNTRQGTSNGVDDKDNAACITLKFKPEYNYDTREDTEFKCKSKVRYYSSESIDNVSTRSNYLISSFRTIDDVGDFTLNGPHSTNGSKFMIAQTKGDDGCYAFDIYGKTINNHIDKQGFYITFTITSNTNSKIKIEFSYFIIYMSDGVNVRLYKIDSFNKFKLISL